MGRAYREFSQHFPQPGWVEHDAAEIWEVTHAVAGEALADAGARPGDLQAVGITNQRETVCVWDPAAGWPLHNAIVWQDRRTAARCEELRAGGLEPLVRERTGLVLDPYFSATKIQWLLENVPGLRARAEDGRAVFGTIDSWLLFKLTGRAHHRRLQRLAHAALRHRAPAAGTPSCWSASGCPSARLPRVCPSAGVLGQTRPSMLHGHAVPVAGVAGDQQAALFGQACVDPGMGKNTYGTGSFVLLNTGFTAPAPAPGLLGTVAWGIGDARTFALEASIFVTGAAVQWLRDGLGLIERAADSEALAASLEGNDGVYFVPALTGLGSPHWDPHARGTIVGLTRGSGRAHLARAALEAIAYQTLDAVRAMEAASGAAAGRAARRRRRHRQRLADAVPGRRARRPGGAPRANRDHRARRRLPRGRRRRACGRSSDVRDAWRERTRFEPRMGEERARGPAGRLARRARPGAWSRAGRGGGALTLWRVAGWGHVRTRNLADAAR